MKKYHNFYGILLLIFVLACEDSSNDVATPIQKFIFEDGFETQNNTINELFPSDASRWTSIQQDDPANATNEITIIQNEFTEGQNAIRFLAYASDTQLSKINIEKSDFAAQKGDKVTINADFYINTEETIQNLLLIDLECCSCWDPSVIDMNSVENQCPGIRLILSGENEYLSIERGKISATTLSQTSISFPRKQWVSVTWETTLSDTDNGINKLSINGTEVINETGMNMPNAEIFRTIFLNQGIDFSLQEPVFYERVQIGATANPTNENIELFVDNFSITIE